MEFIIHGPYGFEAFTGDDRYSFDERGLLVVTRAEEQRVYSPNGWHYIREPREDRREPKVNWSRST